MKEGFFCAGEKVKDKMKNVEQNANSLARIAG
jgi:hypothetical protein